MFAALTPQTTVEQNVAEEPTPALLESTSIQSSNTTLQIEASETSSPITLLPAAIQSAESYQLKSTDVYTVASIEKTTSVTIIPKSDAVSVQTRDEALRSMDFTLQEADDNLNQRVGLFISEECQTTSEVNLVDAVLDELDVEFEWEDII